MAKRTTVQLSSHLKSGREGGADFCRHSGTLFAAVRMNWPEFEKLDARKGLASSTANSLTERSPNSGPTERR